MWAEPSGHRPCVPSALSRASICDSRSRASLADLVVGVFSQKHTHTHKNGPASKPKERKAVVVPRPLPQNSLCLALSKLRAQGSTLDVGVLPPISGDPMPHGLCSSPTLQRGSAPHGCCIPCHKSTFLHNRGTQEWSVHSGSRWVGCRSVIVEFQTSPSASSKHPYWWRCFPKAG